MYSEYSLVTEFVITNYLLITEFFISAFRCIYKRFYLYFRTVIQQSRLFVQALASSVNETVSAPRTCRRSTSCIAAREHRLVQSTPHQQQHQNRQLVSAMIHTCKFLWNKARLRKQNQIQTTVAINNRSQHFWLCKILRQSLSVIRSTFPQSHYYNKIKQKDSL